jgi:hypothetical protein
LRDLLRRCDVEETLRLVATVAAGQAAGEAEREAALPDLQLALVVRYLLEAEPERRGRIVSLSRHDLAKCCEMAAGVVSSPGAAFGVPVSDSAWSLAHRIAYQQFPDQGAKTYAPRSRVLYREIAPRLQDEAGFRFEEAFEGAYGLGMDDAWKIGGALYRWCLRNPGASFDGGVLAESLEPGGISEASVQHFLGIVACDFAAYRSLLGVPSGQQSHFEPYTLNPLRKYPVLRLPDGCHLVPVPGFLVRRITHGLYYDLIELDRARFIGLMGRAFRAYVGRLLHGQPSDVAPLFEGGPWAVSNPSATVLVECITLPFGALSRSTGNHAEVRRDLARRGGVVDCVKRLQGLAQEADDRPAVREALRGKRVIRLVVALEDFYLANGPFIRGIVGDELESQGHPRMEADVQLAHVIGLESLCALSHESGASLIDLMVDKVDQADFKDLELDVYARFLAARLLPGRAEDLRPSILRKAAGAHPGEG